MVKKEKEPQPYRPKVGEKIFCDHGGTSYEAKVLDVRQESSEKNAKFEFLIHYQGWNKSWDEWVGEHRVLPYNETNIAIAKEQELAKSKSSSKSKGSGSARKRLGQKDHPSNTSTISSQGSVSESISIIESEELPIQLDKDIKIKIPDELKNWLIDDDNNIKTKKLTVLPAKPNISTILKDFILHKKTSTKTPIDKEVVLTELTLGIKDYFNVMLGAHLLYKFERLQYQSLLKENGKDVDLTQYYGVIHLVRLFTRIGKYLAVTTLDSQSIQTIVNYIQDLLKFISKQPNLFDLDKNYTMAPPDYIKNALK